MDTDKLFMCLLEGPTHPDTAGATWWQAADGRSWRGYFTGPQTPGEQWVELAPVTQLAGASRGHPAPFHYVVETDVSPASEEEFNAWYDTEHLPGLAAVPGTVRAFRFLRQSGSPRYIACYDLTTPAAMESAEWLAVRHTPWSSRVRSMFSNTRRTLYHRSQ